MSALIPNIEVGVNGIYASLMDRTAKPKETRAEIAYASLKTAILSNELPAGYQAMEPELALSYGVSRTTIREALIRLEADGLVEMVPRRGARVVPISAEDMREIYQLLVSLESDAAYDLAKRGLTPGEFKRLEQTITEMAGALDRESMADWAKADDDFHRGILDIHGNQRLGRIVGGLSDQAHRARLVTRRFRPLPSRSVDDHRAILAAIDSKKAEDARRLYSEHRQRGAAEIMDIIEKLPQV